MGIIKAVTGAVSGALADQWLEVIEPDDMGDQTVFTSGVRTREGQNQKGTDNTVSNGSIIHVYDNQFMILLDGGKIVDYTAEPGYYKVDNSSAPSFFNGEFKDTLTEALNRIKFGGETPKTQKVYYLNLQEIKGIKFGTRVPINYYDTFYDAELFLRAHGSYSIKITNPILFYQEVVPRNKDHVDFGDVNDQYIEEFLTAFQSSVNQMSGDGIRISLVSSKGRELGKYMAQTLDEEWGQMRGMEIQSVGVTISYDDKSTELLNMRNEGSMLKNANIREGYLQGHMARGFEAAGSNDAGAMTGFMGMGMGMMNAGGGMMGGASQTNMQQMQMENQQQQAAAAQQAQQPMVAPTKAPSADGWTCACGAVNTGKFCNECGTKAPEKPAGWTCGCGAVNTGKFCSECGSPAPAADWTCACGAVNTGKFCSECGKAK